MLRMLPLIDVKWNQHQEVFCAVRTSSFNTMLMNL